MNYLLLILSWGVYLFLHSLLATDKVKAYFHNALSIGKTAYRLLYSVFSLLGLIALISLMAVLDSNSFYTASREVRLLSLMIATWGVIIISISFRYLSGLTFLGLRKDDNKKLITVGIHAKIRHPIYSGTLLILIGMFIYAPTDITLVTLFTITAYLPIGIKLEENKLIRSFGNEYLEYKQKVSALIPGIL